MAGLELVLGNTTRTAEPGRAIHEAVKDLAEDLGVEVRERYEATRSAELHVWFEIVVGYLAARALIADAGVLTRLARSFLSSREKCRSAKLSYDDGRKLHLIEAPDEQMIRAFPELVESTQVWMSLMPELATSASIGWAWQGRLWVPRWCSTDRDAGVREDVPLERFRDTARFIKGTPGVNVDVLAYTDEQLHALIEQTRRHVANLLADGQATVFDPDAVFSTFVTFARARVAAVSRMPLLAEVRARPLPPFSGTSHFDRRGYFERTALEHLRDDADALLGLWSAAAAKPHDGSPTAAHSPGGQVTRAHDVRIRTSPEQILPNPRVLVSYSHDSEEHRAAVLRFAEELRERWAVNAIIDRWDPHPPVTWPRWMHEQIEAADYVVSVCTATYRLRAEGRAPSGTGAGATREGGLIDEALYAANGRNEKFVAVLLTGASAADIPAFLSGYTHYRFPEQAEDLARFLHKAPRHKPPAIAAAAPFHSVDIQASPPAPANADGPWLVGIGSEIVAWGSCVSSTSELITIAITGYLDGDDRAVQRFVGEAPSAATNHYLLLEEFGQGRRLSAPPIWKRVGATSEVTFAVAPPLPRTSAHALGRNLKLGADGDLAIENGSLATVAGVDAAEQAISCVLGMQLGEWFLDRELGTRIAEFHRKRDDQRIVERLWKLEIIRCAYVPTSSGQVQLGFIRSVEDVRLVGYDQSTTRAEVQVHLILQDVGEWTGRLLVFAPGRTQRTDPTG